MPDCEKGNPSQVKDINVRERGCVAITGVVAVLTRVFLLPGTMALMFPWAQWVTVAQTSVARFSTNAAQNKRIRVIGRGGPALEADARSLMPT